MAHIALTTPFNPGDVDPGKTYTKVVIDDMDYKRRLKKYVIIAVYETDAGEVGKVQIPPIIMSRPATIWK